MTFLLFSSFCLGIAVFSGNNDIEEIIMQKVSKTIDLNILFILIGILFVLISFFLLVLILDSDDFQTVIHTVMTGFPGLIISLRGVS